MKHRSALLARVLAVALTLSGAGVVFAGSGVLGSGGPQGVDQDGFRPVQRLLDLSGLVWMGGDTFLAVHDAKFPDEPQRVRTSLLQVPESLGGIQWLPLRPHFPEEPSSDLESAARIPGTQSVLLLESGDDASGRDRIYLARVEPTRIRILDVVEWSSFTSAFNVEGAAVARTGGGYLLIWAERAEGEPSTVVHWTDLSLDPFAIGASGVTGSASFTLPDELAALYNRPLVGIDVDCQGRIYAVTAFDPDADSGPFRSAVLVIGSVENGGVEVDPAPTVLGTLDGLKVESVALREDGERVEIFVGTDDEYYGGTLRPRETDRIQLMSTFPCRGIDLQPTGPGRRGPITLLLAPVPAAPARARPDIAPGSGRRRPRPPGPATGCR